MGFVAYKALRDWKKHCYDDCRWSIRQDGGYYGNGNPEEKSRRNPSQWKVVAKGVVLKISDVVIDIPDQDDEDDIFGDDQLFDEDVGGQKEAEVYVETAVVTPVVQSGDQGPTQTSLQKLPQKDVGSPSGVQTSFTISGPIFDSLGALHSEEFGSYTDEQMIADVPLYHDIAPVFDNLALNRSSRAGSCQGSGARCAKSRARGGAVEEGR
ncbi:hypothetical protein C5167_012049, partial [Papaver somniferum]